jgi:ABC-2 type transport system permease protein
MATEAATSGMYRVKGPGAMTGEWRRFFYLATTLALMDWKLRFFGSVLGYIWSLLRPLMLFGILYLVFGHVVRIGAGIPHYPILLLVGVMMFAYFSEVTGLAVTSMLDREPLVRKVSFPRLVIPLSVAMTASLNLGLNLLVVGVFVLGSGVDPSWTWLLVPVPVLALVVFSTGVAMLVSALYVPFRDVKPIWEVVLQALFYATPIFYSIQMVQDRSETLADFVMANPVAAIIQETRHLILGNEVPGPSVILGGHLGLLVPGGILVGLVALGFFVFNRMAPHAAERL